ncbi:MAG: ATP-dependent DNA helicase RecG [Clostridia bacterium]|nr:ATP-dependent DNA helicase RecG [Clostridia bacterium]
MELKSIRGISETREKELNKLGVFTAEDLVRYYPRAYLDLTTRMSIRDLYHNDMALVACTVTQVAPVNYHSRLKTVQVYCQQNGEPFRAVWFNQPYVAGKIKQGEYLFYGRVQNKFGQVTLTNPTFEPLEQNNRLKGIVPVYSLKAGLSQKIVRDAVKSTLQKLRFESVIPEELLKKYAVLPLTKAYYRVHFPESVAEKDAASERIALEEYFILLSAFQFIKGGRENVRTMRYSVTASEVHSFASRFPFEFTDGQKKAVNEIFESVHSPGTMNRLLQGDVGSGKTAVALCGIFMAVKSGYQAAYLSPTEVLARQNYELLCRMFPDYEVGYLSGASTAKEKREVKQALKSGKIRIVCGTHALIQDDVEFECLSFCVCDEQHRFGVAQRASLDGKGVAVDTLVMSATPIPRTLSLIFYGDLDVTTITDKPKARQEISTSVVPEAKYNDMLAYVGRECKSGKQAYFVCPKIEGDEEGSVMSVTELYEELKLRIPTARFALLHGKLKDKEKNQIMQDFKAKKYDCLVSTTVIEVGVDVPDATIMVIYNSERFGLSQLHQLRGRVGRGKDKSYCFLLIGSDSETARERLAVMRETTDGFKIAERDLEIRGSGDFMGTRQSGKVMTDLKNLRYSAETIFMAKRLADEAMSGKYDISDLRIVAMQKYNSLKEIVLN